MDPDCPKEKASRLDWVKESINEQIDLMKARPKTQSPFFNGKSPSELQGLDI